MINISEGIDIKKTSASKYCDICHYWYFLNRNVKYEPYLSKGFHDLIQEAIRFNVVAMISVLIIKLIFGICAKTMQKI